MTGNLKARFRSYRILVKHAAELINRDGLGAREATRRATFEHNRRLKGIYPEPDHQHVYEVDFGELSWPADTPCTICARPLRDAPWDERHLLRNTGSGADIPLPSLSDLLALVMRAFPPGQAISTGSPIRFVTSDEAEVVVNVVKQRRIER